jgi:hypothetical protein
MTQALTTALSLALALGCLTALLVRRWPAPSAVSAILAVCILAAPLGALAGSARLSDPGTLLGLGENDPEFAALLNPNMPRSSSPNRLEDVGPGMQLVHWGDEEITRKVLDLAETDIVLALREVDRMKNSGHASECHHLTHEIGRVAWKKTKDMYAAFNSGFDVCDFGFYHGVVEGVAIDLGRERFMAEVPAMCDSFMDNYTFRLQCYHGAGHAAVNISDGDLNKSFDVCIPFGGSDADMAENRSRHEACNTGVSMEWFGRWRFGAPVTPEVPDSTRVCDLVTLERFKDACFEYLFNILPLRTMKPGVLERDLSARLCDKIAGTYRTACYVSFLRYLSGSGSMTAEETVSVCARLDEAASRYRCGHMALLAWLTGFYPSMDEYRQGCARLSAKQPFPEMAQVCTEFDGLAAVTLGGVAPDSNQKGAGSVAIEREGSAVFRPGGQEGHDH